MPSVAPLLHVLNNLAIQFQLSRLLGFGPVSTKHVFPKGGGIYGIFAG